MIIIVLKDFEWKARIKRIIKKNTKCRYKSLGARDYVQETGGKLSSAMLILTFLILNLTNQLVCTSKNVLIMGTLRHFRLWWWKGEILNRCFQVELSIHQANLLTIYKESHLLKIVFGWVEIESIFCFWIKLC